MADLVWSDPDAEKEDFAISPRSVWFLPQQELQRGWLHSTNMTGLLFPHVLHTDTPFVGSMSHSEARDTHLVLVSSTNSSRQTICHIFSVHINFVWKVTRPYLTNISPRYGPRPIIVIAVAIRRVFSKWDRVGVCTLMSLKLHRRTSGTDQVNMQRKTRVPR